MNIVVKYLTAAGNWDFIFQIFDATYIPRIGETIIYYRCTYKVEDVLYEFGSNKVYLHITPT